MREKAKDDWFLEVMEFLGLERRAVVRRISGRWFKNGWDLWKGG